jgi:hypothetical protein
MPLRRPPSRHRHGLSLLLCGLLLLGGALTLMNQRSRLTEDKIPWELTDVSVEHGASFDLTVNQSEGKATDLVEFTQNGKETVLLRLPDAWILREVRGAALSSIASDTPDPGIRRWQLPPSILLSFSVPHPSLLVLHNAPVTPFLVRYKRANVVTKVLTEKTVLVKEKAVILR